MLFGMSLVYGATGSVHFGPVATRLAHSGPGARPGATLACSASR